MLNRRKKWKTSCQIDFFREHHVEYKEKREPHVE